MTRLAILGCGGVAKAHAQAACALETECEIVALLDLDAARAQEFARDWAPRAAIFGDFDALLEHAEFDAALVCTPPASHFALVRRVLEREIAVLCEKPLVLAARDAQILLQIAEKQRCFENQRQIPLC